MKHIILILVTMLMTTVLFGQQKFIENAMLQNRKSGTWCVVYNESNQILEELDLKEYCTKQGFFCRVEDEECVTNGKGVLCNVLKFRILPKNEADAYIYDNKNPIISKPSFEKLSVTGKGWFFTINNAELLDNIKWSGIVQNGLIQGNGFGYVRNGSICYFVEGEFVNGFPKGDVQFAKYKYFGDNIDKGDYIDNGSFSVATITFGDLRDDMVWVKRDKIDTKYGFVSANGKYVVTDKYKRVVNPFRNGRAEVVQIDGKEIVIDKNCNFVGYTERQQEINAEQRRIEEERLAEQHRLEEERRRIEEEKRLAEQRRIQDSLDRIERARVEEERRRAEHERKITVNCNYKLWSKGDHICYVFPNGSYKDKIACGTLEEWNENRTKAHIKIVTSPSNSLTYDGELLEKNNTFWISTQGTKWHLAIQGEFEKSLEYDNSKKSPDVIYVNNQSSSDVRRYNDCSYCHGSGRLKCLSCHGSGWDSWDDKTCTSCRGQGTEQCYHCGGTGKE